MKNFIGFISLLILVLCTLPMDYKCREMNDEKYLCINSWDLRHFEGNNQLYADAEEWSLVNGDRVLENNWTTELVYEYAKKRP